MNEEPVKITCGYEQPEWVCKARHDRRPHTRQVNRRVCSKFTIKEIGMKITEFKTGDNITRNKPVVQNGDRSYQGDRVVYLGSSEEAKLSYIATNSFAGEWDVTTVSHDWWLDGWEHYPVSVFEKAKRYVKDNLAPTNK